MQGARGVVQEQGSAYVSRSAVGVRPAVSSDMECSSGGSELTHYVSFVMGGGSVRLAGHNRWAIWRDR
jgi:hypothetical protein